MMDDRSERLRKRRKRSTARSKDPRDHKEEAADAATASKPSETSKPPETSEPSESDAETGSDGEDGDGAADEASEDDTLPVKEQQTGTYMYLPDEQVKELRRRYNVLKANYEFEYNEEFEKNRHFYPLVVRYGLEELADLDTSEVRARLEELYEQG